MKKIYSIPFGSDFIDVLKRFITDRANDISRTAVVFPGKRPSLYLKRLLAEHFQRPFYSPEFFSIEEFVHKITENRYREYADIEYTDAIWLLYKSVQSLEAFNDHKLKKKGFGEFFSWGHYLLGFINQLDMQNIPNANLRSLETNAEIGYDVPESINELLMNISVLREEFHKSLRKEKCLTRGLRCLCSLDALNEIDFPEFDAIYFAGLFAVNAVERELIKTIWQQGKGEIIFEGSIEEWPILQDFSLHLGAEIDYLESDTRNIGSVKFYAGFDTHSQIMKTYKILKTVDTEKTAVVLPLSESLFPLLTFAVDRIDKEYNISLGYPFTRTSVFDLIAGILKAQLTKRKGGLYSANDYLQVIMHPFVKNLTLAADVRQLVLMIEKSLTGDIQNAISNKAFIRLDEVDSPALLREPGNDEPRGILSRIHSVFFENIEGRENLYEMTESLEEVLHFILRHTPIRSYILSGEIFKQVYESLENLKHAKMSKEKFHPDREENERILCDFVLQYLKTITLPFETKPIEQFEILGVLETRNMAFDTVIMLDVNEGIMPQQKKIDPLIPVGIYEKLGIPSPEFNEEIYRYYFYRLIRSAKNVHLLYIDAEDRPRSRYIEQILWEDEKGRRQLKTIPVEKSIYRINLQPRDHLPEIAKTEKIMDHLRSMAYSASAIDDYINCPVLFYYSNILKFDQKRTVSEDIEAMDRGNMVHQILFDTFAHFIRREINRNICEEILRRMDEAIEKRFADMVVTGDYYLFKALTGYKLGAFLRRSINNATEPFMVEHLEAQVRNSIDVDGCPIILKGRIDRVDCSVDNSRYVIIDYKTGGSRQYPQSIPKTIDFNSIDQVHEHVRSFQLPIYVYLFHTAYSIAADNINAKLALLKNNDEELLFKDDAGSDRASTLGLYMSGVKTVLKDMLDNSKPFRPFDDNSCAKCSFTSLCHLY